MKILNLVNKSNGDISYNIQRFPDGQQQVIIHAFDVTKSVINAKRPSITIKSRLNNWLDLELIVASVASLRELGVEEIHLYTPYIVGARSDRKFEEGGNNYLRDVICPIINSLEFKTVTCIDPHSDVLEACIKGFNKKSPYSLLGFALRDLGIIYTTHGEINLKDDFILISPDAGASKKIYKLAEQIGYQGDIYTATKDRDEHGKLTKCIVPIDYKNVSSKKDIIIIDDICDGGQTFINISDRVKKNGLTHNKIYLIVTHGIFSKGFEELSKYFDGIYCTNSYEELNLHPTTFVKQLNVF